VLERLLAVTLALGLLCRKPISPEATLDVPPKSKMKSNVILVLLLLCRDMSHILLRHNILHVRFSSVSTSNVSSTVSVCYDFPVSTPKNVLYCKENLRDGDYIGQEYVLGNNNTNKNVKCTTEMNT